MSCSIVDIYHNEWIHLLRIRNGHREQPEASQFGKDNQSQLGQGSDRNELVQTKTALQEFVGNCGVCLRFKGIKARPPLGPSLVRVEISIKPFEHMSLDTLGHIRLHYSYVHFCLQSLYFQAHSAYPEGCCHLQSPGMLLLLLAIFSEQFSDCLLVWAIRVCHHL